MELLEERQKRRGLAEQQGRSGRQELADQQRDQDHLHDQGQGLPRRHQRHQRQERQRPQGRHWRRQRPGQQRPGQRRERRADRHLLRLPRRQLATLLAAGVAAGVIGGYALGSQARSRAASGQADGGTGVYATAECTSAVARANSTISWAVRMGRAFVQQTQVVNQLARGETSVPGAVQADRAPSADGAAAASKFNDALAEYLRVVDSCQLQSG